MEDFLFYIKLVVEPLFLKVLLELSLEDEVENSFLCLRFWDFKDVLGCFLKLVRSSYGINDLKNMSVQRIIQMLNTLDLKRISLYPSLNLDLRSIELRRLGLRIFEHGRVFINKGYDLFQISDRKHLLAFFAINQSLFVA